MGINIALMQMTGCGLDKDASRTKGELFCRRAQAMGADIALFPEMWSMHGRGCHDQLRVAAE